MYKDINKKYLFDNVNIGFEFEFFSPLSRKELSEKLTKVLKKNVHWTDRYHSSMPVAENDFKIEPDFSGGFKMNELVTGVMPYNEAVHVLFKVFNFINEHGFTSERTGIHVNISFNELDLGLKDRLQNLNVFKYILNLNEAKIFEMWPSAKSRMQKIYKNSVLNIYPKNKFIAETGLNYAYPASPLDFKLPHAKYFGLNFTKLSNNYLEIRYAGGAGYETKKNDAVELINYMAESLYETLKENNSYSVNETRRISEILTRHKTLLDSVKTYESFTKAYPEIELYVDLRNDPRIVESNYQAFKEKMFELITTGNLKKGIFNYDTSTNRVQLKDVKLKEGFSINGIDFINCSIEGEIQNCVLYGCKVRSSRIKESKIITGNDIRYSYLKHCSFERDGNNRLDLSYIKNEPGVVIYGDLNECIISAGTVGFNCKVDSKTEFLKELRADHLDQK
jgi:hypothetical protein